MSGFDDYGNYDATGLASLIGRGEVSAREVNEAAIAAIEARNPALNAVVSTRFAQALDELHVHADGPLHGVPFLLKDFNTFLEGLPCTNGSRIFESFVPAADSELIKRFKAAGLCILGKTNTPEFGLNIESSPVLFGPCVNPFDATLSPGGSSGGSAAAVAAGMVPAAHATDSGGSIRIPASNCGLYGLKPSRARVPLGHGEPEGIGGFSHTHVLSHTVRDSALLLDVTAGAVAGDPYQVRVVDQPFVQALEQDVAGLRVALCVDGFAGEAISAEVQQAARDSAAQCESLGCTVEPVKPPVDGERLRAVFDVIFSCNVRNAVQSLLANRPDDQASTLFEPATLACAAHGARYTGVDYVHAVSVIQSNTRALGQFFERHDVLLTPTLANPPLPLGTTDMANPDWPGYLSAMLDEIPFTPLFNASGCPAASLPLGRSRGGLPIGVQLGAALGCEDKLLALSAALERSVGWNTRC